MNTMPSCNPLPSIPKTAHGTEVRESNPIKGPYRVYHQSINSQKNFDIITQERGFYHSGFVKKFRNNMPSINEEQNGKQKITSI